MLRPVHDDRRRADNQIEGAIPLLSEDRHKLLPLSDIDIVPRVTFHD
jgi:hypothetical protein